MPPGTLPTDQSDHSPSLPSCQPPPAPKQWFPRSPAPELPGEHVENELAWALSTESECLQMRSGNLHLKQFLKGSFTVRSLRSTAQRCDQTAISIISLPQRLNISPLLSKSHSTQWTTGGASSKQSIPFTVPACSPGFRQCFAHRAEGRRAWGFRFPEVELSQ